jgi:multiple sugar transport system permease protein
MSDTTVERLQRSPGTATLRERVTSYIFGVRFRSLLTTIVSYIVVVTATLIVILPLIWVVLTSLKTRVQAYSIPPVWVFTPTLENYAALMQQYPFARYFLNSAMVALSATLLALLVGLPAAYSFARFNTGGTFLRGWVLNNRTMPHIVILIPFFLLAQTLKLTNTYTILIIAYLTFSLPFVTWMLTSFLASVPREMEEAALIDGASQLQTLRYVTIPLAAPGIAATGILCFLYAWNEFIFALILTGGQTRTLPIAVANFLTQRGVEIGQLSAATTTIIIPVIILTFSIRGYLVRGLSFGGIK